MGCSARRQRRVALVHRLLSPTEIERLLVGSGLTLIATWGGFGDQPLDAKTEQHVYLVRRGLPHHS